MNNESVEINGVRIKLTLYGASATKDKAIYYIDRFLNGGRDDYSNKLLDTANAFDANNLSEIIVIIAPSGTTEKVTINFKTASGK
mgnify:CR=1 FL=1